jgi:adenosylhomocysteinase
MSLVKNPELKNAGLDKINWVRSYMPVLSLIEKRFEKEKPFKDLRITISIHLEAKTAYLATVLKAGGANVAATGCNPLSTQDDVAAALASLGVETYAWYGATEAEYNEHLRMAMDFRPHIILDDGGDLVNLLHDEAPHLGENLLGGCEETTTGVMRLRAREKGGKLNFPMISVNDAKCKHLFDNRYGTGQSVWDGIMHTTNLMVTGKTVVVAGFGLCGKGIAMRAKGLGANVIVTEIDPVKALEASMEGYLVMPMSDAAKYGDLFVTVTGCEKVITKEHFMSMKDGVVLANAGHFDVEIDKNDLTSLSSKVETRKPNIEGYYLNNGKIINLLAEGRLVNLAAGNGHPAEIMDMSFAIQSMCLKHMAENGKNMSKKVYEVPDHIDEMVANMKLEAMGMKIDTLTAEQKEYLLGW